MQARVKDNGAGQYLIDKPFVHRVIGAVWTAIIGIGAYMIVWAINDAAFKSRISEKVQKLEERTAPGILERADERMSDVEEWQEKHEREHP